MTGHCSNYIKEKHHTLIEIVKAGLHDDISLKTEVRAAPQVKQSRLVMKQMKRVLYRYTVHGEVSYRT